VNLRRRGAIGGGMFSESFRSLTVCRRELTGEEGLFTSCVLFVLPYFILRAFLKVLPAGVPARDTLGGPPARRCHRDRAHSITFIACVTGRP
jgi:hypothetical protein